MKIISKGNKAKTRTCEECGCEFEFDDKDVFVVLVPRVVGTYTELFVKCPQCYERIFIGRR